MYDASETIALRAEKSVTLLAPQYFESKPVARAAIQCPRRILERTSVIVAIGPRISAARAPGHALQGNDDRQKPACGRPDLSAACALSSADKIRAVSDRCHNAESGVFWPRRHLAWLG